MHENTQMKNPVPDVNGDREHLISTDQTLAAIQFARRLQRITASIENFFQCQINRLENAMATCNKNVAKADEIQETLASLVLQKQSWEKERQAETARLDRACAQLTEAWKQLEDARRQWLTEHSAQQNLPDKRLNQSTEKPAWLPVESTPHESQPSQTPSRELNTAELETLRRAMHQHRNSNC